jgi:hypothetical protein
VHPLPRQKPSPAAKPGRTQPALSIGSHHGESRLGFSHFDQALGLARSPTGIAQALNPVNLGAVADFRAASITALLTPANFPALTTTSTGGAASFSYADPQAGPRTFLAINNADAGFSAGTDAILEITGFSGNLNQLQLF